MADAIDLTTLDYVKTYAAITGNTMDALLSQLITAASRFAMSYCSRVFMSTTYNKTFNGTGGQWLILGQEPVTAVSSVTVNGVVMPQSTQPHQNGWVFDDVAVYFKGGCYVFERGVQNVTINFTAGYADVASVPQDLQQAIAELVWLKYKRRDTIDVASKGLAGETISYIVADMNRFTKSVLNLYTKAAPVL